MMMILGGVLLFVAVNLALIGTISMLVIMFKDRAVWGIFGLIGVFFLAGIPQIVYLIMNFGKFAKAFFTGLLGAIIAGVGSLLLFMGMFNLVTDPAIQKQLQEQMKQKDPKAAEQLEKDFKKLNEMLKKKN